MIYLWNDALGFQSDLDLDLDLDHDLDLDLDLDLRALIVYRPYRAASQ